MQGREKTGGLYCLQRETEIASSDTETGGRGSQEWTWPRNCVESAFHRPWNWGSSQRAKPAQLTPRFRLGAMSANFKWGVHQIYFMFLSSFLSLKALNQGCPTRSPRVTCGPGWLWMRHNTKSSIFLKHYQIFLCVITCCNVFNVWPKTTLLLPVWPRDAKSFDTPATVFVGVLLVPSNTKRKQDHLNAWVLKYDWSWVGESTS